MRVAPAILFTQSRVAIVCLAVRNSFISDSDTFFGGRDPPSPGTAAELLLVMMPTETWLSRYTSFMNWIRWKFSLRLGRPTSSGFQGVLTLPSSSGRLSRLKLVVQHEQVRRRPARGERRRDQQVLHLHVEEGAEHLVHRKKASRHSSGA